MREEVGSLPARVGRVVVDPAKQGPECRGNPRVLGVVVRKRRGTREGGEVATREGVGNA